MLHNFLKFHNKYENVDKLYNIQDICDDYIVIKEKELHKLYIYDVEPLNIMNITEEQKSNTIERYTEFLRKINMNFQILIRSNKFDVKKYVENVENVSSISDKLGEMYHTYLEEMTKFLSSQDIYTLSCYIIVSIKQNDNNIQELDSLIYSINKTGCKAKRIIGKDILLRFIYQNINKVKFGGGIDARY